MKKLLFSILTVAFILSGCSTGNSESDNQSSSNTKSTDSKHNIDLDKVKEFTQSLYDANKVKEVKHLDKLGGENVQQVIKRQFMGADFEKSDRYDKSASNVRLYKDVNDNNRYLATLEVKTRDTKEKKMIWLQKTIQYKIKNGKIDSLEEIGEREIFNEQK